MVEANGARERVARGLAIDDGDIADALTLEHDGQEQTDGAGADDEDWWR
jgi:hypothetical protein